MKRIFIVLIINIAIFAIFIILFYIGAFLAGYADSGGEEASWRLYIEFILVHLFINLIILRLFKILNLVNALLSCLEIIIFYGINAWISR